MPSGTGYGEGDPQPSRESAGLPRVSQAIWDILRAVV